MDLEPGKGGIMIVDDTLANLRLLEGMLRDKGLLRPSFSQWAAGP